MAIDLNMTASREFYMNRCLELAAQWAGFTAPNPMVGAVLVYKGRIIGEGAHQHYGGPHAEVNCLKSVDEKDRTYISHSTLYVSLEPCAHYGKTPPCAQLIIKNKIPHVIVGIRDPFPSVNGKGIDLLQAAGINVEIGLLETECRELNRAFFCFHQNQRPYIILKWAQTSNGVMGASLGKERLHISSEASNRLVHKWRRDAAAIMIGTNTALLDDPQLDNRYWPGPSPLKVVIDKKGILPTSLNIFKKGSVLILTEQFIAPTNSVSYLKIDPSKNLFEQLFRESYDRKIQSILVEGGAQLLNSIIKDGVWDEARVITNTAMIAEGIKAPSLHSEKIIYTESIGADKIAYYKNTQYTAG